MKKYRSFYFVFPRNEFESTPNNVGPELVIGGEKHGFDQVRLELRQHHLSRLDRVVGGVQRRADSQVDLEHLFWGGKKKEKKTYFSLIFQVPSFGTSFGTSRPGLLFRGEAVKELQHKKTTEPTVFSFSTLP